MTTTQGELDFMKILRERPYMAISDMTIDYSRLRVFIEGYIYGLGTGLGTNLMLNITHWFQRKVNQKTNYFFTNHIPLHYKDKSDEELKNILLQTLEDFFNENPDWTKKYVP